MTVPLVPSIMKKEYVMKALLVKVKTMRDARLEVKTNNNALVGLTHLQLYKQI